MSKQWDEKDQALALFYDGGQAPVISARGNRPKN